MSKRDYRRHLRFAFLVITILVTCLAPSPSLIAKLREQTPSLASRHPDAGIWVMYRGQNSVADLQKPYIKGVMAYAPWYATYKGPNDFNWFRIDRDLDFIINQVGKRAMIDVTVGYCPLLDWPQWMRERVASHKTANIMGCPPLQFWDPLYIDLHKSYIRALANHLAEFDASDARPTQTDITFVRAAVMAETMENLPNDSELSKWGWQDFIPATNGRIYQVDLTKELNFAYQAEITLTYQRELARAYAEVALTPPVAVAKGGNYWNEYPTRDQFVEDGVWLGQHSGSPNPQGWYYDLYSKVKSGETRGASETGGRSPEVLLSQYAYWEILANLHYGVEFIGIYGNNRFAPKEQPIGPVNYPENQAAMVFGERYAGHYRNPVTSPGAWVALRGGYPEERFGGEIFARRMWTNYEFLMTQLQPQESVALFSQDHPAKGREMILPSVSRAAPQQWQDEVTSCLKELPVSLCEYLWQQPTEYLGEMNGSHYYTFHTSDLGRVFYCGEEVFCSDPNALTRIETMLWARRTNGEAGYPTMRFDLNDTFAQSLGGRATIRVVYLDQGSGQWELHYDSASDVEKSAIVVQKSNSNQWKEVVLELSDVVFANRQEGDADLSLFNMGDDDDIFHMVEVTRVTAGG